MGTILTSDTSDVGWHSVPRDGSERPRGLSGKQLCQSAWSAAFEALGSSEPAAPLLLVAIGSQADALEGLEVPKNACCHSYLPQVEVLKAGVDVFLTHGGQNSFMEALMADVPVVVWACGKSNVYDAGLFTAVAERFSSGRAVSSLPDWGVCALILGSSFE